MTSYPGIFLRNALGDDDTLPRSGSTDTASPDVINAGATAASDPQASYGDTYDQAVGKDPVYGQRNYIYVRGKNSAAGNVVGSAALYWCYATQLDTPSNWQQLSTVAGANASPLGGDADAIAVTATPFVWTPPASTNPYVLIAAVSDANNPNPVPAYTKASHAQSFAKWQSAQGGVSAMQFTAPTPPAPKPTYSFSGLLALGNSDQEQLSFSVLVANGVVGDHIACSLDAKDANGAAMGLGSTQVSQASMSAGFQATVPAGFASHFTFNYAAQGAVTLPQPTLTLQVSKTVSGGGGGGDPFDPGGGNAQAVVVAQFTMTTALPS
jgi:hypothetical protein